jgi:hypothetical protein
MCRIETISQLIWNDCYLEAGGRFKRGSSTN